MQRICQFSLVLALSSEAVGATRDPWPEVAPPPKAHLESVGENMRQNGLPVRIHKFAAAAPAEEVLAFYRKAWGTQAEGKSVENRVGPWQVIGKREGDYYISVQVQPQGPRDATGLIGITQFPESRDWKPPKPDFPAPEGSKLLSQLDSVDAGRANQSLSFANQRSVAANADFYTHQLTDDRWVQDPHFGGSQANGAAYGLLFRRDRKEATVIIQRAENGSFIFANIVEN